MRLATLLSLSLLLVSCSTQAVITLKDGGGMTLDTSLRLGLEAKAAWASLRELDPSLPVDPVAPELLSQGLGKRGQATRSGDATVVRLTLDRPADFVSDWKTGPTSWEATIDRATLRRWAAFTSWSASPAVDSLLPAPGTKITEAEYRELLAYLLGPAVTETRATALIANSTVELTVVAPRVLVSAPGASEVNGRSATYRWPLTRLLTLDPPLKLRVNY